MAKSAVKTVAYEDIELDQQVELDVQLTPALVDEFAKMTGDVNPLHQDDAFAKSKGFSGRLAHGLLVGAFFSTIAGTLLPGRDCLLQNARFAFKKPVYPGEKLKLTARVVQKVDAFKLIVMEIEAKDSSGEVVVGGRLHAGVI